MTVTDAAILILSLFFLGRGAARGFINSLAGPFSIIVATILSIIYYQATKNITVSLLIGLAGPFLLSMLLRSLFKTWARATDNDIKPGFLSRLAGAVLTLAWGWVFIFFTLIMLTILPAWGNTIKIIHADVARSISYSFVKPFENAFFAASKENTPGTAQASGGSSAIDAKTLAEDPRFQKILQDPDIQKEIDAHDMGKLMSNPKMLDLVKQIMNDPATMNKVMALYKAQVQPQSH